MSATSSHDSAAPAPAPAEPAKPAPGPSLVTPSPHLVDPGTTTRRMMADVLIGLAPLTFWAIWTFHWPAVVVLATCTFSCLAFELGFAALRGRKGTLNDLSAAVTGVILGLSMPWSVWDEWYVSVIASGVAIGIGKIVFGGLGQNLFNPAMVGRAFVMISFPAALGAAAYQVAGAGGVMSQATPLTAAKMLGEHTALWPLFVGNVNGSLGEVSALACLVGGLYLCVRRTASWEIPAGALGTVLALAGLTQALAPADPALKALSITALEHLCGGALLFGAFFIATDPVSSPLTPKGKLIFGAGFGALVFVLRVFSGYPEGVMFAVLVMNALVPLINRGTVPVPLGGPVPAPGPKEAKP